MDNIEKYNTKVKLWKDSSRGTKSILLNSDGNFSVLFNNVSKSLLRRTETVDFIGNTDSVDSSSSVYLTTFIPLSVSNNNIQQLSVVLEYNGHPTSLKIDVPRTFARAVQKPTCGENRGKVCRCSVGTSPKVGNTCSSSSDCGTCTQIEYLQGVCLVMDYTSNGKVLSSSKVGCKYPFHSDPHYYGSDKVGTIKFSVRPSDDPYISLQEITKGTMDFGVSHAEKYVTGMCLLVIGICLIVYVWGGACYVFTNRTRRDNAKKIFSIATGRPIPGIVRTNTFYSKKKEAQPVLGATVDAGSININNFDSIPEVKLTETPLYQPLIAYPQQYEGDIYPEQGYLPPQHREVPKHKTENPLHHIVLENDEKERQQKSANPLNNFSL